MPQSNRQVRLARRPAGLPVASDFAVDSGPVPVARDGEVLVRTAYVSVDPAQRGWVIESDNYVPALPVGSVMRSFGVGEVVESRSSRFRVGQLVSGLTGWQEWSALPESDVHRVVDPADGPVSTSLGVLGLTGLTAWVGMIDVCRPTSGSTVVVSTAAGSVGSAAGQIAKAAGARTVGITGSDAKVRQCLDKFGFDEAINYKTVGDLSAAIGAACPDGVDAYFDSVGGSTLDAVMGHLRVGARIAICGTIGQVGAERPVGPRWERQLLVKRASITGFLASDHWGRSAEVASTLGAWIREGRLAYREEIVEGLESAPTALERLLAGDNLGKVVVAVAGASAPVPVPCDGAVV